MTERLLVAAAVLTAATLLFLSGLTRMASDPPREPIELAESASTP